MKPVFSVGALSTSHMRNSVRLALIKISPVASRAQFLPLKNSVYKPSTMKKSFFMFLARVNKLILPSYSKRQLDLAKASKLQLAIIGWRYYVTTKALE